MYFSIGVSSLASLIGLVLWYLLYRRGKSPPPLGSTSSI